MEERLRGPDERGGSEKAHSARMIADAAQTAQAALG